MFIKFGIVIKKNIHYIDNLVKKVQVTHNSISGQDVRSDSNSLSVDEIISFPWSVFDRFVRSLCHYFLFLQTYFENELSFFDLSI